MVGHLDPQLSRWRWLVTWLLLIPHVVVLIALGTAFVVLTIVAAVAILFTGRCPRDLFDLVTGFNRWVYRVIAYVALMTDEYPRSGSTPAVTSLGRRPAAKFRDIPDTTARAGPPGWYEHPTGSVA